MVNVDPDGNAVPTGGNVVTGAVVAAAVAGAAVAGAAVAGAAVAGAAVAGAGAWVAGAAVGVGVPPQAESTNTKARLRKARRIIILRIGFFSIKLECG